MAERFHVGTVLSVMTDTLLSPAGFNDVHRLMEYMCGEPLWTHQLIRAGEECKPSLRAQFPHLRNIFPPMFVNPIEVWEWVAKQVAEFGEMHEVQPLRPKDHTSIDPLTELALLAPHVEVVPVVADDGEVRP